jgi:hypothetical protein
MAMVLMPAHRCFPRKPVDIAGGNILSGFDATMVSIDGIARVEGAIFGVLKEQGDVFVEPLLVVFDLDDVVGLFFDDGLGDFLLTAMASMVTMAPSKARVLISSGMAVISLDLSSVLICPSTSRISEAQALTMCIGDFPLIWSWDLRRFSHRWRRFCR